jgi:hypothetical protein
MMLFVTVLNFCSKYLARETLEGLGDFKIGGQIIWTVKYADDFVLLAKEEMVLQGMIDRLIKTGRYCGMEMNVEKTEVIGIPWHPSPVYARSKTTGECGTFQLFA